MPDDLQPILVARPVLPVATRAVPMVLPVERNPLESWLGPFTAVVRAVEWCFGVVALLVALAVLSSLPVVQFLALGYMLECGGRVAHNGRLREAFVGVRRAARLGGIALGIGMVVLPISILNSFAYSAALIDPAGRAAQLWRLGVITALVVGGLHIAFAVASGGRLWRFLWPFNFLTLLLRVVHGGWYTQTREALWRTLIGLHLLYLFWLGLRGFIIGFAWLVIPVSLFALQRWNSPAAPGFGFAGAALLVLVLPYVPFLQLRMAERNSLRAGFQWSAARRTFRAAPWAHALAFTVVLASALPLYVLKIEVPAREAAWLPGLLFVGFIWPAKVLTGWALSRANRRGTPRHWLLRWSARFTFWPLAVAYVIVLFFAQYTSWAGLATLYEQHAFLLPFAGTR